MPPKSSSKSWAPATVYSLNCEGGKKYVGMTKAGPVKGGQTPVQRRVASHFAGNGAKFTQKNAPVSVNHTNACSSNASARAAETKVYNNMKSYHGAANVRGAGNTSSKQNSMTNTITNTRTICVSSGTTTKKFDSAP